MQSDQIEYVTVRGFKSIRQIEDLKLGPLNVLIGANGSGKSNFIGIFTFLHEIREGRLQDYVARMRGANRVLHFGSKVTEKLEVRISFGERVNQYALSLSLTEADSLFVGSKGERVYYWDKERYKQPYDEVLNPVDNGREAGISQDVSSRVGKYVRNRLSGFRVYHFHDTSALSPLRRTSELNDNKYLRSDGANLPAFLYLLKKNYDDHYQFIRKTVKRVAPFFDDFHLEPDRLNSKTIRLEWKHKNSDQYFDASSLSDGTLRFIALATLFLQPRELRPSAIIIDEPELGLHPSAITFLASMAKSVSNETQVILSTQSSLLLDSFEPADVLVAEHEENETTIRRLKPEPLQEWLSNYSLGQLWEKNELGGRPA